MFALQVSSESQVKKLEEQLSESTRKGDDLQRVLTELSVAKNRLTGNLNPFKLSQVRRRGIIREFNLEAKWKTGLPTLIQASSLGLLFTKCDRSLTCTHVHVFNGN